MSNQSKITIQENTSYQNAFGTITYNMTNDYMFRFVLQRNQKVLTGIVCSLLHLKPEQIESIIITNPINLSEDIGGKDFILDINVLLNNNTLINLEMQVANEHNWSEMKDLCLIYVVLSINYLVDKNMKMLYLSFILVFSILHHFPSYPNFMQPIK